MPPPPARQGFLLLLVGTALAAAVAWVGGTRQTVNIRLPSLLEARRRSPSPPPRPAQPEAVLRRQVGSLRGLVAAAARGDLLAASATRALVVLDQALVEGLLQAQLPSSHLVGGRFRVAVSTAQVTFDDGLALVRIDGRVRLEDAPEDVYADLVAFGDLHLAPRSGGAAALRMRITVTAVEARRVEVGVRSTEAHRLVEEVSRTRLEEFAALAPELDVPVRWAYSLVIPGVGPEGPVNIEAAAVDIGLRIHEVRAMAGHLWLGVDLDVGPANRGAEKPPAHTVPAEALEDPDRLRAEHTRLHQALSAHLDTDPVLSQVTAAEGDLTFVLPAGAVTLLGEEVAARYLDRVALALDDIRVSKEGEFHSNTMVGKVHSGSWRLAVELDRVRGVLRAGRPRIALQPEGRIAVTVPVWIEKGHGQAALHFRWDSHGIANLVCRDFEVREKVEGDVVKEEHSLSGFVTLTAEGDGLRLLPRFERRHRIHVAPGPEAWDAARRALASQDTLFRCGLGLKPEAVLARIQEVVGRGFVAKLPESLFRPLRLPAVLAHTLHVADREVEVSAVESAFHTSPERVLLALRLRLTLKGPGGGTVERAPGGARLH